MYEYRAKIIKIVDGDTVDVDIDLGFGISLNNERVRIMGIDTPESRTRDKVEKKFGLASKNRLNISVKVKFINNLDEENNYDKTFSRYVDYDSYQDFSTIEESLNEEIINQLIEDIFNEDSAAA